MGADGPAGGASFGASELSGPVSNSGPGPGTSPQTGQRQPSLLLYALGGYAVGFVVSVLATTVAEEAVHYRSGAPIPLPVLAASTMGLWTGLLGAALAAARWRDRSTLARAFGFRIGRWWDLPLGAAVGVACQLVLVPLLYLPFEQFDPSLRHQLNRPAQADTSSAHTWAAVIILFLVLAVGAPLVEELFFRGVLLRGLRDRFPIAAALVLDAALFGLAHFEAAQFAGLAVFGLILAILAWKTGRLAPNIAAHGAFNAVAVISLAHPH